MCHIIPDPKVADKRYLFHALCRQAPIWIGQRVGGAQPNISQGIVKDTHIPLPPLTGQRRIAAILDKADAIRRKREEGIRLTEELLRSTFLERFGDPVANSKAWPTLLLEAISGDMTYGTNMKCSGEEAPASLPVLAHPKYPAWANQLERVEVCLGGATRGRAAAPPPGDLLFVRTNGNPEYIGRCAMFSGNTRALFASYLIRCD